MTENEKMIEAIKSALADDTTLQNALTDYWETFKQLGFYVSDAAALADKLIKIMQASPTIEYAEKRTAVLFSDFKTREKETMQQALAKSHDQRIEIMYNQIKPQLPPYGELLDFGCGSGKLAAMIAKNSQMKCYGCDIHNSMDTETAKHVEFIPMQSGVLNVPPNTFNVVILANVAHHERFSAIVLNEVALLATSKVIMFETFASNDNPGTLEKEWGRIFLNDVLWNRFFNSGDIPVPGSYATTDTWIANMQSRKFIHMGTEDYGYDQPMIRVRHQKMWFQKQQ